MTVRCSGDSRLMEQVGEKQDFESALTQHGLHHEDFMLIVHRPAAEDHDEGRTQDYTVTVVAVNAGARHSYAGGPRHSWVAQFVTDAARGVYGPSPAANPAENSFAAQHLPKGGGDRTSPVQRGAD